MFVHERHSRILDYLQKHPSSSVTELQDALGISRSTLRRDLVELEEREALLRVHGGVVHRDSLRGEPSYDRRGNQAILAKKQIAKAAAALVPADSVVFIDAGTTCVEVALQLSARPDLRIYTHSVRLLIEVGDCAARVNCIGGEYRPVSQALVGGLGLAWIERLNCNMAFLGASGLSPTKGISTTELSEATMKQAIIQNSDQIVVVADARKWDEPSTVTFAHWNEIQTFVTNQPLSKASSRALSAQGTKVVIAQST
ncbi:DeoR/GlpR family DNA-binding transcription regulator [Planctomicrobium sp. SH668]|uniref:DeoR/GlpR family DNA-binding transcription regulator n=1 Tax=Planctomicrobium sp. SH668 TaxID=3448126 RepID=UPI003F5BD5D8